MKKLFAAILFAISFSGSAQENSIEVNVNDTIMIKPAAIEYRITATLYSDAGNDTGWTIMPPLSADETTNLEANADAMQTALDQKTKELKSYLEKKGYKPKDFNDNDIASIPYTYDRKLTVTVVNLAQIQKLRTDVKQFGFASLELGTVNYGNTPETDKRLLKKLVAKARANAQAIGEATGQKPGKIVLFKETGTPENLEGLELNIHDVYLQMATQNLQVKNGVVYGSQSKSATVKFEAQ